MLLMQWSHWRPIKASDPSSKHCSKVGSKLQPRPKEYHSTRQSRKNPIHSEETALLGGGPLFLYRYSVAILAKRANHLALQTKTATTIARCYPHLTVIETNHGQYPFSKQCSKKKAGLQLQPKEDNPTRHC